ncbi:low molecular weight phosphotyrosine protein phosphatase [Streptomyces sp. NPDC088730]|uniref:arsenate reductase/protein-tyrosine-phosphatase family protein n=1 Tax=Streptomyces sp. NPDC088730 TaxID=3365877 RepID=UPI00381AF8AF
MNILTVCLGNYCRSPFAALVLDHHGSEDVQVRSAGLIGKWRDRPANSAMIKAAGRLGYDLSAHRAQRITLEMLDWADTVLTMDTAVLETLRTICTEDNAPKLGLYLGDRDVPDPMGQDQDAFNRCAVLIETGTALHIGRHP